MRYKITTPPATEPVSLAEARKHLRVDATGSPPTHPDDDLILAQIQAAREWCEGYLNRAIMPQVVTAYASDFQEEFLLPFGGASSVVSIKYTATDGSEQTVDPSVYDLDTSATPSVVYRLNDGQWPLAAFERNAVRIEYAAGYTGSPPAVPERVKRGILLLVGDMYENREKAVIGVSVTQLDTVQMLLHPLRELGL